MPVVGCGCGVCRSTDPRNRRTRTSALLRLGAARILIDASPDFRAQALREGIDRLDAVVITHEHADHVFGLDDLRPLSLARDEPLPIFAAPPAAAFLRAAFGYVFADARRREGIPWLQLHEIALETVIEVQGARLETFPMEHGAATTLGVRVGDFAWMTDLKRLPSASLRRLAGVRLLALDMLRAADHPTHLRLEESLALREELGAPETWFIHMNHEVDHEPFQRLLPAGCALAWDGLRVDLAGLVPVR